MIQYMTIAELAGICAWSLQSGTAALLRVTVPEFVYEFESKSESSSETV